jgi:hypothetical protein
MRFDADEGFSHSGLGGAAESFLPSGFRVDMGMDGDVPCKSTPDPRASTESKGAGLDKRGSEGLRVKQACEEPVSGWMSMRMQAVQ